MTCPTSETQSRHSFLSLPLLRDLLVVALIVVVVWKLLVSEVRVDLSSFSFNDVLALVLALFSVGLSVAFYFKANDASNQFYDNTYKFTKEMSEILGRIEAGFGERLRHLDEGYSGMRDRLEKLPQYGASSSDIKAEEEQIALKTAEQRGLIDDLAAKAKLAAHEKLELFKKLGETDQALYQARMELRQMQTSRNETLPESPQVRAVLSYLARKLKRKLPLDNADMELAGHQVRKLFRANKTEISEDAIADMRKLDLLDANDDLSKEAVMILLKELKLPNALP